MANKLDRLLFVQGGLCFFCQAPLPKSEASVEHLVALANDGSNTEENCVACCKAVNGLLGSLPLKEKVKAILLQPRPFKCPANIPKLAIASPVVAKPLSVPLATKPTPVPVAKKVQPLLAVVIDNLKGRKSARPATVKTLSSSIKALRPSITDKQVAELVAQLIKNGVVIQTGSRVSYKL